MNVMESIQERRSVRRWLNKEVPDSVLNQVMEAGRLAPSACNEQGWRFLAVTDPKLLSDLAEATGEPFVSKTPAMIAVCIGNHRQMMCGQPARTVDGSIALSFMMLEAVELGLGTCWLGHFDAVKAREILNVPADWDVMALATIGYPDPEDTAPRTTRKDASEICGKNTWSWQD